MAVLLETSKGDIVLDLFHEDCPLAAKNFLKLCKIKYYNNCEFHDVQENFICQTGDPTGTGRGGESIYGVLYGQQARFFKDEVRPHLRHRRKGALAMASAGPDLNASQFYITAAADLDSLDEKHTVFGEVSEGLEVVEAISRVLTDAANRPLQVVRIRHTVVLEDPIPDPPQLAEHIPERSPSPLPDQEGRLGEDWRPEEDARPLEEIEEERRAREADARAVVLEMIGDLPTADAAPPSDFLFVCKLNPVTTEEDLEIIFSRFGNVKECNIIRDWKTGDSLNYAFIGFDTERACEEAFFKMNNCLVDDRRIKVDFSQSVYHLWKQYRTHGKAGTAEDAAAAAEAAGGPQGGRGGGRGGRGGGRGGPPGGRGMPRGGRGGPGPEEPALGALLSHRPGAQGDYALVHDTAEEPPRRDREREREAPRHRHSREERGDDRSRGAERKGDDRRSDRHARGEERGGGSRGGERGEEDRRSGRHDRGEREGDRQGRGGREGDRHERGERDRERRGERDRHRGGEGRERDRERRGHKREREEREREVRGRDGEERHRGEERRREREHGQEGGGRRHRD